MIPEKRRAPRSRHDSVLEIYDDAGHRLAGIARLVDFSNVGVCFSSTKAFTKGQKIQARLRLLKEGRLEISGHIVWVKRHLNTIRYGLAFDSIHRK